MRNPFKNLNRETAIDLRAKLDGLATTDGYRVLEAYFTQRASELRSAARAITNDDFATINNHNRNIYKADAIDEVLQWLQDAMEQIEGVIGGKR